MTILEVDLRSDTVTRPTAAMRETMFDAPLGDDVFGDDPTVLALQDAAAKLLRKEAALYVPSGTMSNQLALRAHTRHGDEVIGHAGCHMFNYESGAAAALAGVQFRLLESNDGTLPIDKLRASIHQTDDPHYAPTTLICLEDTHNACGGVPLASSHIEAVHALATQRNIPMHLDGARLFNATVAKQQPAWELAARFDTVSICLSKGLGAPVGSVLLGSEELIRRAYRYRKMYGGGMRQAGVIAAAGLYALEHHIERLADDHRRAKLFAEHVANLPGFILDPSRVSTNLVYFGLETGHPLARIEADDKPALVHALARYGVAITGGPYRLRAAFHLDIDDTRLEAALAAFTKVSNAV